MTSSSSSGAKAATVPHDEGDFVVSADILDLAAKGEVQLFNGEWDAEGVYVYQAYKKEIGDYALEHGRFGGEHWGPTRMTWIKPSFGWMLYRSGYGKKPGQERVLRIKLSHETMAHILEKCQLSIHLDGEAPLAGSGKKAKDKKAKSEPAAADAPPAASELEVDKALADRVVAACKSLKPAEALSSLARQLRDEGLSQEQLQAAYDQQRAVHAEEETIGDAILETMDIIAGFCPPGKALFETQPPASKRDVHPRKPGDSSSGRVQWDPERDLHAAADAGREPRKMLRTRAIQIGMAGALSEFYAENAASIEDWTGLAHAVHEAHKEKKEDKVREKMASLQAAGRLPNERPYMPMCGRETLLRLGMLPGEHANAISRLGRGKAAVAGFCPPHP